MDIMEAIMQAASQLDKEMALGLITGWSVSSHYYETSGADLIIRGEKGKQMYSRLCHRPLVGLADGFNPLLEEVRRIVEELNR